MAGTVIRLVLRLALLAALFWVGRAVFKRWVEGPEPVASDRHWETTPSPSPEGQAGPLPDAARPTWGKGKGGGGVPGAHPVKAKVASRVYRVPGMASYDQTKPD